MRWAGHVARMGDGIKTYKFLLGKPERKYPRGRRKRRCDDNIIRDLKKVGYEGDWKALAQDRVTWYAYVLTAINLQVS